MARYELSWIPPGESELEYKIYSTFKEAERARVAKLNGGAICPMITPIQDSRRK